MIERTAILVVDRNRRNLELLAKFLERAGYETLTAATVEEFEQALSAPPALALVDIAGLEGPVSDYCRRLQERQIPFLLLSRLSDAAVYRTGAACGAIDVVAKPLTAAKLKCLIRGLLAAGGPCERAVAAQ